MLLATSFDDGKILTEKLFNEFLQTSRQKLNDHGRLTQLCCAVSNVERVCTMFWHRPRSRPIIFQTVRRGNQDF